MKKRERRAEEARMAEYIAALVPLFRLEAWDIVVGDGPPENPHSLAAVTFHRTLHDATIRFADSFYARERAEQRQTVAHELLHLVTAMENVAALTGLESLEGRAAEWALSRFDHEYERATDALARIIAPALPLPPPRDDAERAEDAAAEAAAPPEDAAAVSAADDPAVRAALDAYDEARVAYNADIAAGRGPGKYEAVVAAQGPLWAALDARRARLGDGR